MKKKILFLFLIASVGLFAQQRQYNIIWDGTQKLFGENFSIEVPAFNKENFTYNNDTLLFVEQWESNVEVNESSVSLSNVVYKAISKAELKDLNISNIPNKLEFNLKNSISRDKKYTYFQLVPIIRTK